VIIAGLDEVGWGALAGPVISVVAAFNDEGLQKLPAGVKDSKQVKEPMRETLYLPLCAAALDVGIGHAWPWEIDDGPYQALQLSYLRALQDLRIKPDLLIVDGKNLVQRWDGNQKAVPKADIKYKEVSAASLIAKVFRDKIMVSFSKVFPEYSWEKNKGYGSIEHDEAIRQFGLVALDKTPNTYIHRMSYCRKFLCEGGKKQWLRK
jgi:ribonuclease HII